jgi:hypothetical protein
MAHAFSSAKIVPAAKVTLPGAILSGRWAALECFPRRWSLVRPTYHDLGAQTTSIEKQDSENKKNLTNLGQN